MKQPRFLLKASAVVSSLLLAGGFIAYRAGALDWISPQSKPAVLGGSKSKVLMEPAKTDSQNASPAVGDKPSDASKTVMSGSKSLFVGENPYTVGIGPYEPPKQAPPDTKKPPAIFYGSKSAPVLPPDLPLPPPQTPAPPK